MHRTPRRVPGHYCNPRFRNFLLRGGDTPRHAPWYSHGFSTPHASAFEVGDVAGDDGEVVQLCNRGDEEIRLAEGDALPPTTGDEPAPLHDDVLVDFEDSSRKPGPKSAVEPRREGGAECIVRMPLMAAANFGQGHRAEVEQCGRRRFGPGLNIRIAGSFARRGAAHCAREVSHFECTSRDCALRFRAPFAGTGR